MNGKFDAYVLLHVEKKEFKIEYIVDRSTARDFTVGYSWLSTI